MNTDDMEVVALITMARANIPTDTQELLLSGNPMRNISPGVLAKVLAGAALAERSRIKALLLEHEPLAGAYIHDLIRAIDEGGE